MIEFTGRKDFIINANKSNYVLVTAETNVKNFIGDSTETISAFLVDLKSPGVIIQPADEKFGCDSIQQHSITFKDVNVSASMVYNSIIYKYRINIFSSFFFA